jgi:hypothetical protein
MVHIHRFAMIQCPLMQFATDPVII